MYWGRPFIFRAAIAYVVSSLLLIVPFVVWNPEGFITATTLFYLTYHQSGDNSSLWYIMPGIIQQLLVVCGPILSVLVVVWFTRTRQHSLVSAMAAAFCCYAIFMAFSKLTHMNYLWSVYPLACVAVPLMMSKLVDSE